LPGDRLHARRWPENKPHLSASDSARQPIPPRKRIRRGRGMTRGTIQAQSSLGKFALAPGGRIVRPTRNFSGSHVRIIRTLRRGSLVDTPSVSPANVTSSLTTHDIDNEIQAWNEAQSAQRLRLMAMAECVPDDIVLRGSLRSEIDSIREASEALDIKSMRRPHGRDHDVSKKGHHRARPCRKKHMPRPSIKDVAVQPATGIGAPRIPSQSSSKSVARLTARRRVQRIVQDGVVIASQMRDDRPESADMYISSTASARIAPGGRPAIVFDWSGDAPRGLDLDASRRERKLATTTSNFSSRLVTTASSFSSHDSPLQLSSVNVEASSRRYYARGNDGWAAKDAETSKIWRNMDPSWNCDR
jgi:hypothetical protein